MTGPARARPGRPTAQAAVGLALAAAIVAAWVGLHAYGVFILRWTPVACALAPVLVALQCWLSVGLFIVAHDGMHGSLAPGHPAVNRAVARLCLLLYAGFDYERVVRSHFAHHRHPGTALDPDYSVDNPRRFWRWYVTFFRRYFGLQPLLAIATVVLIDQVLLGVAATNILLFWALPALLSSVQLFYFGTFLPHRLEDTPFDDVHKARSAGYSWLLSLMTCYHFGHHHEHHLAPHVPWWRLPRVRGASASTPAIRPASLRP